MSKIVAVIKRLFVQNWKMKLIALIFAFILWSFVIAEDNPYKTKTFRDFPVTYTAADELRQKDLTTSEPLAQLLSSVTVTAQIEWDFVDYAYEVSKVKIKIENFGMYGKDEHILVISKIEESVCALLNVRAEAVEIYE